MSFTLEQFFSALSVGAVAVGAMWAVFVKLSAVMDAMKKDINFRFDTMEGAASRRFERAEEAREALRKDVSEKRHEYANATQQSLNEIHERIDSVKTSYARREDVVALTNSMNNLSNVVSRLDGMFAPVIAYWQKKGPPT